MSNSLDFSSTSGLDFTLKAEESFENLIPDYADEEIDPKEIENCLYEDNTEKIYNFLVDKFCHHGFCDYLKRYIYLKTEMTGRFDEIPNNEYQKIIIEAFRDNATDFSFYPTKAHSPEITLDWLKRFSVSRETVMLLGFGLKMSLQDVNELLHKGLHEPFLDPKEPFEAACHFCLRKGHPFPRFMKIMSRFDPDHPQMIFTCNDMDSTARYQDELDTVNNDDELLAYLYHLPLFKGSKRQSISARREFDQLYDSIQIGLIKRNQRDEVEESGLSSTKVFESAEPMVNSETAARKLQQAPAAEIKSTISEKSKGNAEIENILYAFVPKTEKNNYAPLKDSKLKDLFCEKRFNRQHIGEIQKGKASISRFDLITMCFLNYDLKRNNQANIIRLHFDAFIKETNRILMNCNMDSLYAANPYECFIMLCMRTESPIEVYSEVWGMSYNEQ